MYFNMPQNDSIDTKETTQIKITSMGQKKQRYPCDDVGSTNGPQLPSDLNLNQKIVTTTRANADITGPWMYVTWRLLSRKNSLNL